jgi:AraC-like DNA-binding protein/methyl-accepting chemotaxis protein
MEVSVITQRVVKAEAKCSIKEKDYFMRLTKLKPRKYLSHIFLLITLSIMLAIGIFSSVIYYNATHIFQQKEYESSSKLLYQIKYNINQMDGAVKNLSTYLFFNNEIRSILYSKEQFSDMVELTVGINRLSGAIMSSNPFIHSISIYNNELDEYFYIGKPLYFKDTVLQQAIDSNELLPKLKPVLRKMEKGPSTIEKFENVFTYYMYDNTDKTNHAEGAVVINVKYEWLLDNLNLINMTDKNKGDYIFILNDKQEFIDNEADSMNLKNDLREAYLKKISAVPANGHKGFFEENLGGEKYLITYVYAENVGFTLLKMQPSAEVYKHLHTLKTTVIMVTIMFLILTFIMSITISRSIYRPIANLLKHIVSTDGQKTDEASIRDEISYLGHSYKQSIEKLDALSKEKNQYKNMIKEFWLKKLLVGSYTLSYSEQLELSEEKSISILLKHGVLVCVIKIDQYSEFQQRNNENVQKLLKFAVLNISVEILSTEFAVEGVDMNDDHIALIISVRYGTGESDKIETTLNQVQLYIQQNYGFSITASVSEMTMDMKEISKVYNDALGHSVYRFVLGRMSVITPEKIRKNAANKFFPESLKDFETKLMECIKSDRPTDFEVHLQLLFKEIAKLDYSHILISLIRLTDSLKRAFDAASKSKIEPVHFNFSAIARKLFEMETIEDCYRLIVEAAREILEKESDVELQARNSIIIGTVSELIAKNYFDPALCQDQIASLIKITPRRLSKIFKDGTQLSIPEYINEIRLNKATEWLENTELSVYEVISKVGIENETYFYAIFKKKFGTTPREYALQKRIKLR